MAVLEIHDLTRIYFLYFFLILNENTYLSAESVFKSFDELRLSLDCLLLMINCVIHLPELLKAV